MDGKKTYYHELDRNRRRYLELGYGLNGVPVDDDHEVYLKERENKEKQQSKTEVVDGSGDSQSSLSKAPIHQPVPRRKSGPAPGSQAPLPSDSGNVTMSNPNPIKDDRSVRLPDRHGRAEVLPKNIWPVLLLFDNNKQFEGKVLLDSGAEDNWISKSVVEEEDLPWEENEDNEDNEDIFDDFNSHPVKSGGVVRAQWIYRHRTLPVKFKIAPNPPWQVLFGCRYLLQTEVLTLNGDNTNRSVAPLTKRQPKPSAAEVEQMAKSEDDIKAQAARIERYRKWREKMNLSEDWTWDKEENNYFRDDEHGGREWCKDGYQINFRVDDALQSN